MAEMKVSEMIEAEQVNDEDLIMIVQNGVNKKVPASKVGTGQAGGDTLPIGSIMQYSGNTIPENWLLCNGQAVNRNNYSSLFSKIGTLYGEGDGSTTFNLPDLRGRVPVGKDENDTDFDTLGNTGGEKEHTLTIDKIPEHQHYIHGYSGVDYPNYQIVTGQGGQELAASYNAGGTNKHNTNLVGGGEPHNNLQPYIVQNYIIKAKQSAGVVATVVDTLTSTSTTDALSAKQGKVLNEKIIEVIDSIYSVAEQGTNINDLKINGKYGIFNATGTLPSGYSTNDNNIIIECIMWDNSYGRQILHDVRSDNTYIRRLSAGTWHSWKIFTIS